MKNRKFLLMAAMMLSLSLTACGGKPAESSKAPQSNTPSAEPSVAPSSQDPAPSSAKPSSAAPSSAKPSSAAPSSVAPSSVAPSSVAPSSVAPSSEAPVAKAVTVTSVNLVAKESKVYLQLAGSATGYTAAEFKWALALSSTDNQGAASEDFIVGTSATFTDADYVLSATLNADNTYLFEYNLSDITGMKPGLFTIHAGVKGLDANLDVGVENNKATLKDGVNRYYIRPDVGNKNTIAVDALPPVALEEASVVTDAAGKIWAKIGGAAAGSITQAVLDAYDSFIQFQQVGGSWTNTRRYKAGTYTIPGQWGRPDTELVVEADQYYWKLEGEKAFLYADIGFFAANTNYNTHLNVTANSQADCKMDAAIDAHYVVQNEAGAWIDINVIAKPGASAQEDFWGNLGFAVTAGEAPAGQ